MIVLLSGGVDSTVLTAKLLADGNKVEAVSVHYGQRHARELTAAAFIAGHYGIRHDIIDLSALRPHLTGSALTGGVLLPDGHAAGPDATLVPNRNLIMLAVAGGIAEARGHDAVATAVHDGDHAGYPDCRPEFTRAAGEAIRLGTAAHGGVTVMAPFQGMAKHEIVTLGWQLRAPMGLSWSCYDGGGAPCGRCGACASRSEAFTAAGIPDPAGPVSAQ